MAMAEMSGDYPIPWMLARACKRRVSKPLAFYKKRRKEKLFLHGTFFTGNK